jgi:hypothetical protein
MIGKVISKWRDITGSQSLEIYLAENFGDKAKVKVSRQRLFDKTTFRRTVQRHCIGAMRAATCFVLQGAFRYSFGDQQFDLTAGDYCDLPEGGYDFEMPGDAECVYVLVFTLPD